MKVLKLDSPLIHSGDVTYHHSLTTFRLSGPSIPDALVVEVVRAAHRLGVRHHVRTSVLLGQIALETNWLKFTGVVRPDMNNVSGMGAGGPVPLHFRSMTEGVTATVAHWLAYIYGQLSNWPTDKHGPWSALAHADPRLMAVLSDPRRAGKMRTIGDMNSQFGWAYVAGIPDDQPNGYGDRLLHYANFLIRLEHTRRQERDHVLQAN